MKKYVKYLRISTSRQFQSGLGLEAQSDIIEHYCRDGEIVVTFSESYSGTNLKQCKELQKAIKFCKENGCILAIYDTDRFRNVRDALEVLDEMGEGNIMFTDLPNTNRLMLTIKFAFAEHEAKRISLRTKAALKQSRARGIKSGMANDKYSGNKVEIMKEANKASIKANKLKAENNENNKQFISICSLMNITANSDFKEIANELNRRCCRTSTGKEFNNVNTRNMWGRHSAEIRKFKNIN